MALVPAPFAGVPGKRQLQPLESWGELDGPLVFDGERLIEEPPPGVEAPALDEVVVFEAPPIEAVVLLVTAAVTVPPVAVRLVVL